MFAFKDWLNFKIGTIAINSLEADANSAGTQKRGDLFKNSLKEFMNQQFQIFDKKSYNEESPMNSFADAFAAENFGL